MAIILYDLCGAENRRFSPPCWRAKFALAHKGLEFETAPTPFTAIGAIRGGAHKTVPVMVDGERVIGDSFDMAVYLDEAYPERPTLFAGEGGRASARFLEAWAATVAGEIAPLIIADLHAKVAEEDRAYFRQSREARFGGRPLEEVQSDREARVEQARKALAPLRVMLKRQPFIGGEAPLFSDYIVAGTLQWPRVVSAFAILEAGDPVQEWFERVLALHEGLGRSERAAA